jgi:hypothetical protein
MNLRKISEVAGTRTRVCVISSENIYAASRTMDWTLHLTASLPHWHIIIDKELCSVRAHSGPDPSSLRGSSSLRLSCCHTHYAVTYTCSVLQWSLLIDLVIGKSICASDGGNDNVVPDE